jgi:hypothetical protein
MLSSAASTPFTQSGSASLFKSSSHDTVFQYFLYTVGAADPDHGSFADLSKYGNSKKCAMPCAGKPEASCGDECTVDLYISDSVPTELLLPKAGFADLGCYRWVARVLSTLACNLADSNHSRL